MNLWRYIKDRLPAYLGEAAALGASLLFLMAFRVRTDAAVCAVCLPLAAFAAREVWDYARRRRFYRRLENSLKELEQKYLLGETLPRAGFYEGEILREALWEAGKSMADQTARSRRRADGFREFIEMWVHQVKIPLSALRLMAHNDPKGGRYMAQTARVEEDVERVLYYARGGSAEKDFVIRETSLSRVFSAAALRHRDEILALDVELTAKNLDVTVMTDGKWLEFIVSQLLSNSLKYVSPSRPRRVLAEARAMPDRVEMRLWDNGLGIPAEDLPRIFDKSFTGENGRSGAPSTGMGLYIVKTLMDRLGHGVTARSVRGEYTEITLSFGASDMVRPGQSPMSGKVSKL